MSVVVRSKDSSATIERTFQALRRQTVEVELIVVDSGSTDGTVALARRWCDRLIEIAAREYTPGRALNLGADAAEGDIVFALSSHSAPARNDWVELTLAHYGDGDVAAVAGTETEPTGEPLASPYVQTAGEGRRFPRWGFSNHASSWRKAVWAQERFDESLPGLEDKEWAWRVLDRGWKVVYDPLLWIPQDHRWHAGAHAYFRRERLEQSVLTRLLGSPPYGLREVGADWWNTPQTERSRLFHLLNYRRLAGLLGRRAGDREARG